MDWIGEVWRRATTAQPAPPAEIVAGTALIAAALVLLRATWPWTRALITIAHEGGHAFAALATGRRLRGIRLHTDTSGLTISAGKPRGPGMVVMLAAGYLAPAAVGLAAVGLLLAGHALGLLWVMLILLVLMLAKIRNAYGLLVVVVCGGGLVAISWYASPAVQTALAYLLTWIQLIAAPKPVLELIAQRRRQPTPQSDVDQLGRLTGLPAGVWLGLFLLLNSAGLVLGTGLLLPALAELIRQLSAV